MDIHDLDARLGKRASRMILGGFRPLEAPQAS